MFWAIWRGLGGTGIVLSPFIAEDFGVNAAEFLNCGTVVFSDHLIRIYSWVCGASWIIQKNAAWSQKESEIFVPFFGNLAWVLSLWSLLFMNCLGFSCFLVIWGLGFVRFLVNLLVNSILFYFIIFFCVWVDVKMIRWITMSILSDSWKEFDNWYLPHFPFSVSFGTCGNSLSLSLGGSGKFFVHFTRLHFWDSTGCVVVCFRTWFFRSKWVFLFISIFVFICKLDHLWCCNYYVL